MGLFQWIKSVFESPPPPASNAPTSLPSEIPSDPQERTPQISPVGRSNDAPLNAHFDEPHVAAQVISPTETLQHAPTEIPVYKSQQRRREICDARFLTKPREKLEVGILRRRKKVRVFSASDARRLFSTSLRTKNRNIRALDTDAEQLRWYGLPEWQSEEEIAGALGISLKQLRHFSMHRALDQVCHYVEFAIPKRTGGERRIHAPKRRLKVVLRKLNELLVDKLPVSESAHGFRPNRSVGSNAAAHVGKAFVVKLDVENCFPTIHFGRVRGLLISLGYSFSVASILAILMTESPRQIVECESKTYHVPVGPRACVQGSPTSPGVCNAILFRLDRRLAGLARSLGFAYTRYADDMSFSGDDPSVLKKLVSLASRIVREEGFAIRRDKTKVQRKSRRQRVTGVTVNRTMGLSRKERRRIRAEIHQLKRDGANDASRVKRIRGKIAYVHMLNPAQAVPLRASLESIAPPAS